MPPVSPRPVPAPPAAIAPPAPLAPDTPRPAVRQSPPPHPPAAPATAALIPVDSTYVRSAAAQPAPKKPIDSSSIPSAPTGVVKLSERKSTQSLSLVYTDHSADQKADTIDVSFPPIPQPPPTVIPQHPIPPAPSIQAARHPIPPTPPV